MGRFVPVSVGLALAFAAPLGFAQGQVARGETAIAVTLRIREKRDREVYAPRG